MANTFTLPALEADDSKATQAQIKRENTTGGALRVAAVLIPFFLYNLTATYAMQTKNATLGFLAIFGAFALFFAGLALATRLRARTANVRERQRVEGLQAFLAARYNLHPDYAATRGLIWPNNPLLARQIPDAIPHATIGTMRGYTIAAVPGQANPIQVVYTREDGYFVIDTVTNEELDTPAAPAVDAETES